MQPQLPPWLEDVDTDETRKTLIEKVAEKEREIERNSGILTNLYLYVTRRCNLNCIHCWISAGSDSHEMDASKIKEILRDAQELGTKEVKVTGGEPFVRKDMKDVLGFIREELGMRLVLETNGTTLTEELCDFLASIEPEKIFISLDGMEEKEHEFIRKSESSFKRTVEGIKMLSRRDILFDVVTLANKKNMYHLGEIASFALEMGANQHNTILNIHPIGRGKEIQEVALDYHDIFQCISEIAQMDLWEEGRITVGTAHTTLAPALQPLKSMNLTMCNWGLNLCGVLSTGHVSICGAAYETMDLVAGNVYETPFKEIWRDSTFFKNLRGVRPTDFAGICGNCVLVPVCRGLCRINAFANYGYLNSPYPICQWFYENGHFPEYAIMDPSRDCSIERTNRLERAKELITLQSRQ